MCPFNKLLNYGQMTLSGFGYTAPPSAVERTT